MKLKNQGLYLSEFEHDNCGAGFICSLNGERTNAIIGKALNILSCLEHRGAVSSDGRTGDGAGILIEIPHSFFAKKCDFPLPKPNDYAVGMVFLPKSVNQSNHCIEVFENEINKQNLKVLGWRNVPVNSKVVGSIASKSQPEIKNGYLHSFVLLDHLLGRAILVRYVAAAPRCKNSTNNGKTMVLFRPNRHLVHCDATQP